MAKSGAASSPIGLDDPGKTEGDDRPSRSSQGYLHEQPMAPGRQLVRGLLEPTQRAHRRWIVSIHDREIPPLLHHGCVNVWILAGQLNLRAAQIAARLCVSRRWTDD